MLRLRRQRWLVTVVAIAVIFAALMLLVSNSAQHACAWAVLLVILLLDPKEVFSFFGLSESTAHIGLPIFAFSRFQRPPPAL
jgi:hypothetical protein